MTLERTETPIHIPSPAAAPEPVQCDYLDVTRVDGDQARYRLQPHVNGGRSIGPALILESESAHALVQHLEKILRDPVSD
jgi:hypothetical protein